MDQPLKIAIGCQLVVHAVPQARILDLWEAFNDVAEGFGLTIIEFREMLQCSIKEYLGFNEQHLVEIADTVFRTFDDDKVRCIVDNKALS